MADHGEDPLDRLFENQRRRADSLRPAEPLAAQRLCRTRTHGDGSESWSTVEVDVYVPPGTEVEMWRAGDRPVCEHIRGTTTKWCSLAETRPVPPTRLEALEEIRQRVADGWWADRAVGMWFTLDTDERGADYEPMGPGTSAVLWPEPPEDT